LCCVVNTYSTEYCSTIADDTGIHHTTCMATSYRREPLGFKTRLAFRADQLTALRRVLAMARLAAELRDSLTPLQLDVVVAALGSAERLVKVQGLSTSQFNALLVLAHVNGLDDLREFFKAQR
jgi:hypothetical protein